MKAKFVRDELFIECMKKWQLEQEGRYHVVFSVGTTSIGSTEGMPFNYMRVTDPAKRSIIIDLSAPRRAKTN